MQEPNVHCTQVPIQVVQRFDRSGHLATDVRVMCAKGRTVSLEQCLDCGHCAALKSPLTEDGAYVYCSKDPGQ
jgi:hypothetical protein